jgi:O-acetyl-ADP-ribose deacetylase (regulator of RNase III)
MKYIQGDLIQMFKENKFDMIGHQCNCAGLFGAGIAKALAKEFLQIDIEVIGVGQAVKLFGTYEYFDTEFGHIINMYSQFNVGSCTQVGIDSFEVRLGALENCLHTINKNNKGKRIGLPLIASGLAKQKSDLDDLSYFHSFILPSVKKCLRDMKVTIVYL